MSPSPSEPTNGVLAQVCGDEISEAMATLPSIHSCTFEQMTADIQGRISGWVRITFKRASLRHGKTTRAFWQAIHAEPIWDPDDPRNVW